MQYVISFLEGIITFISPCLLPMLPIYISYFAGGGERRIKKTITGALGFVLGFTLVFMAMGALAGTVGSFLREYQTGAARKKLIPKIWDFSQRCYLGLFSPSVGRPASALFSARH